MYSDVSLLIMKRVAPKLKYHSINMHYNTCRDSWTYYQPYSYAVSRYIDDIKTIVSFRATCKGACVRIIDLLREFDFSFGRCYYYELMFENYRISCTYLTRVKLCEEFKTINDTIEHLKFLPEKKSINGLRLYLPKDQWSMFDRRITVN